ncbi:MAG: hypothetical protein H7Z71_01620 [Moraxellaceae bacterium]|nr:hypothetical protein [Pseudobdellovibrionaceae bacterium]
MKNQLTVFFALVIMSSTVFAQNTSTTKMTETNSVSSQGIRFGVVKSTLDASSESSSKGSAKQQNSTKVDETYGLSMGYASLPLESIGWTANVTFLRLTIGNSVADIARIDGNLAYAFNKYIHLKGGLNGSKFTRGDSVVELDAGLGGQLSLGLQFDQNFGLDVGYTELHQSGQIDTGFSNLKVETKLSGLEVGLHATF